LSQVLLLRSIAIKTVASDHLGSSITTAPEYPSSDFTTTHTRRLTHTADGQRQDAPERSIVGCRVAESVDLFLVCGSDDDKTPRHSFRGCVRDNAHTKDVPRVAV
jgi:hypothetical protein